MMIDKRVLLCLLGFMGTLALVVTWSWMVR